MMKTPYPSRSHLAVLTASLSEQIWQTQRILQRSHDIVVSSYTLLGRLEEQRVLRAAERPIPSVDAASVPLEG